MSEAKNKKKEVIKESKQKRFFISPLNTSIG